MVNKLGSISNQFRVFDMEVIAGDKSLVTEVVRSAICSCHGVD